MILTKKALYNIMYKLYSNLKEVRVLFNQEIHASYFWLFVLASIILAISSGWTVFWLFDWFNDPKSNPRRQTIHDHGIAAGCIVGVLVLLPWYLLLNWLFGPNGIVEPDIPLGSQWLIGIVAFVLAIVTGIGIAAFTGSSDESKGSFFGLLSFTITSIIYSVVIVLLFNGIEVVA